MATPLPPSTDFTGGTVTEGGFKTAITTMRQFLSDLIGATGNTVDARAALGTPLAASLTKTANYTVVAADCGRLIDCTSGTFTLSLTAAATLGDGFAFAVRNSGTGVVTIDPNGSEQIDGATTITLAAGETAFVMCTGGTAFKTVARSKPAQTRQDVTASRAIGSSYTNSTGQPIDLMIVVVHNAAGTGARLTVGGIVSAETFDDGSRKQTICAQVLPGEAYSLTQVSGSLALSSWVEVR